MPAMKEVFGLADSTIYLHISQGLLTKPVNLGPRAVGWPADEIDEIINARIAGQSEDQIRSLVSRLMTARQTAA
jgi:prophage regulatory protein